MMREVKFRVWDKKEKVMISHSELFDIDCNNDYPFLALIKGYYAESGAKLLPGIDPNTMQCTGLKDKNGTEIYEGDITTNELCKSEGLAFVVFYDSEKAMFKQRPFMYKYNGRKLGSTGLTLQMDSVENKEVIGNIYENSELLQGGNN